MSHSLTTQSRWVRFIAGFWRVFSLLDLSLDVQWFKHVKSLGVDLICRRLTHREYTLVISLPYVCRIVFNLGYINTLYRDVPSITETGFEITSHHIRLSWCRALVGKLSQPGMYWIRLWRDIIGTPTSDPYVKRMLDSETHHYYYNNGVELRVHAVEVEAILYGQRLRGRWGWPASMERQWVEIRVSQPIATQAGFITRHVYEHPTAKHLVEPLAVFREDLVKMGLYE